MEIKIGKIRIVNNKIIISIPPIIQNSIKCLKSTSENDVTESHNVILLDNQNQRLYVDNLEDFRLVLKQFYIYKKLCTIIENAIDKMKLRIVSDKHDAKVIDKKISPATTVELIPKTEAEPLKTQENPYIEIYNGTKQNYPDADAYLEISEASTSAAGPSRIMDSRIPEQDDLILCGYADDYRQCASRRNTLCPATCQHGLYLEMLPDGKRLLRKKGCCAVM